MPRSQDVLREAVEATKLTKEEFCTILAAERRRRTFETLAERTMPVDLETVAVAVVTRAEDLEKTDEDAITRVTASLHHTHLPKLENIGVVEYNPELNQIEAIDDSLRDDPLLQN